MESLLVMIAGAEVGCGEMTFAVHSLHAPPVEIDERNRYSLTEGRDWIQGSEPIHTADTKEEAEQWQAERKQG